ncbi:putative baseplate wedge subunit [Salmonella phage kage]|uniref:Putative baseplate wedge subunit n=1 Tax=Salmonella phage kage TaxID=2713303 RepID=A0A6G9LAJ3_9CAUD|nr:putative baseplate wedge subunit [Salmonella phage kage]
MSKDLNNGHNGVKYETPLFYQNDFPLFIEFMDTFFNWLYRQQGFTQEEILAYLADTSSWMNPESEDSPVKQLIDLKADKTPGSEAKDYLSDKFLVRTFENMMALDAEELLDADGRPLLSIEDKNKQIDDWYNDFGFQRTVDKSFQEFGYFIPVGSDSLLTTTGDTFSVYIEGTKRRTLDHPRWLKLLKHIYKIRGTKKAIELFFWIYFGCPVSVYFTKEDIGGLDGNFECDGTTGMRDDYYYDEYTYVIGVPGDVSDFEGVFERVFRQHFHPAGFTVFLESTRS